MTVVYIDKVLVLNWLVDYLLLLMTARLGGMPLQRRRLALWAGLGALYAGAVFLPGFSWAAHPLLRLAAGTGMAAGAYWPLQRPWRLSALFLLLSAALGGGVMAVGLAAGNSKSICSQIYYAQISWSLLLGTAVAFYGLLHLVFRQGARHGGGELMTICVSVRGKQRELLALHDTGNTLRDPVNGQPVLVLEQAAILGLWDERVTSVLSRSCPPEEKIARLHSIGEGTGFTLLPFRSVGAAAGLLLAVRSDYVRVGRATYRSAWIALAEGPLSDGGAYRALWGGSKRGEEYHELDHAAVSLADQTQQAG